MSTLRTLIQNSSTGFDRLEKQVTFSGRLVPGMPMATGQPRITNPLYPVQATKPDSSHAKDLYLTNQRLNLSPGK